MLYVATASLLGCAKGAECYDRCVVLGMRAESDRADSHGPTRLLHSEAVAAFVVRMQKPSSRPRPAKCGHPDLVLQLVVHALLAQDTCSFSRGEVISNIFPSGCTINSALQYVAVTWASGLHGTSKHGNTPRCIVLQ